MALFTNICNLHKNTMAMLLCQGIQKGKIHTIEKDESHYLSHVLRKQIGDTIEICDGVGSLYEAEIISIRKKEVQVRTLDLIIFKDKPESLLQIAIAPTKNINRFEWFLEKVTEIGVSDIHPIITAHSERTRIRADRFERIIRAAMKQSGHLYKPILHPLSDFTSILEKDTSDKFIAYSEEKPPDHLINHCQPKNPSMVLIGPEGDFSEEEFHQAKAAGYKPVSLGTYRLRTETAGISAAQAFENKRFFL